MVSKDRSTERPRPMRPLRHIVLAFCTAALIGAGAGTAAASPENVAAHAESRLRAGAVELPLHAELAYSRALDAIGRGDLDAAKESLESAIALAPHFTDSYFTLARVEARRFSPDAIYWLVQGVVITTRSFDAQAAFLVNAGLVILLVFLVASAIVWVAFAIRYFPFLAHRLAEWLKRHFNAAAARPCAYLLLLAPFALLPGYAPAVALLLLATWPFMQRRERVMTFLGTGALAALMWFAPVVDRYTTVADPLSTTSLIARANESGANPALTSVLSSAPANGLEAEQQTALGLLAMRAGEQEKAVAHFLRAIEIEPSASIAYVNLGNVYFLNAQYDKALEGYRKAEQVNPADAVGQYNLAQAYIQTLMMSESSKALERASQAGFDPIRESFATRARETWTIYPRIYAAADLWRMAATEGRVDNPALVTSTLRTVTGLSPRLSFWLLVAAMLSALALTKAIKRHRLAFQCGNCGEITCNGCCGDDRGNIVCGACHKVVEGVTSDRVLEALLRQRRQSLVVRRRRSIKWATVWLPGLRHVYYGRLVRGSMVAAFFAASLVALAARGYILPRWSALEHGTPAWMWILPLAGIVLAYTIAITSRQLYEVRTTRGATRQRTGDGFEDDAASAGA